MKPAGIKSKTGRVRCAIYTRKSSEEGLEQDFNSLDAQREACEAYVKSQRHEGWEAVPARYDDGGFSGGTLERPALQRLLADMKAGKVDVVVVYKVDRLTRSLADFAKIVEVLDAHGASFVSVTQQFNTTTSMGRLTLNVLLSFAQFEREVTGERIRDKIAASKKKGMWMGGYPPLGYEVMDRRLVVQAQEVQTVRHIFRKYAELGSVHRLKEALDAEGILSKTRKSQSGRVWGGKPLARGALYLMLQNRVYLGEVVHKGQAYPGEHEAIIDPELWEKVQRTLKANRVSRERGAGAKDPSLLGGMLHDDLGERMTPTHAVKKGKRYRYYVSRTLVLNPKSAARGGRRIPAGDIEHIVLGRLQALLANDKELIDAVGPFVLDAFDQKRLLDAATPLMKEWPHLERSKVRALVLASISRIDIQPERVDILISPARLVGFLRGEPGGPPPTDVDSSREALLTLTVPARLRRTGMEMRMLVEGEIRHAGKADRSLVRLIVKAHALKEKFGSGGGLDVGGMTRRWGTGRCYITRLLRLTFL
ncbi:MAG: recombinase family protein, partial [Candidatus Kerfeldbacteria bacterium]|nr:recombinase family protein [Candidatus Kerfeldbacteria bacterium]